jgi:signal peptidase II
MILNNLKKSFYLNSIFIFLIFILDRTSKIYVINLNNKFSNSELFSSKFLNINLIWNKGIAFGLFSFNRGNLYDFITIFILIIIFIIFVMIFKNTGFKRTSLIMIFGGAIGNLYDRIFYKAVPDFIDIHVGSFHWFIFNVSDIFITLGVIGMITFEIFNNDKVKVNEKI